MCRYIYLSQDFLADASFEESFRRTVSSTVFLANADLIAQVHATFSRIFRFPEFASSGIELMTDGVNKS